ncbi:MAG: hypothetical protein COY80_00375 [Candidatus Pacebacteria bacterium CG_4_10_14_0_8_um_filter_42_14]|nr:MAG: hypothetical protein COY80_00375 [Candidatus Pacebacteria bacterium CG_4_10_14_0_8_um_filter_42_14]
MKRFLIVIVASLFLSGCSILDKNTTAGLQVITNDKPSSVFLDGQFLEKAPLIEKNIKPGTYGVRIEPDDPTLVPYETSVTLRKGLLTVITWKPDTRPELSGGVIYEMEPLKNKQQSEVSFITIPDGAIVALDGHEKEFAPVIVPGVDPGQHEFEITLPSYESQQHTINVVQGYRMIVRVKLAKLEAIPESEMEPPVSEVEAATQPPADTTEPLDIKQASPSAEASPSGQLVRILPTNFFQDDREVLRVRSQPSTESATAGFVEANSTHTPGGEAKLGWNSIIYNGALGWVSSDYSRLE